MFKRIFFMVVCVLFFSISVYGKVINVKDFGTKGDGKTDDTKAIQTALDEAFKRVPDFRIRGVWEITYPEIVFPEGTYILSNMVRVTNGAIVRGEGRVILKQTNPEAGIMDCHWALRILIENIIFEGGKIQLNLFTYNTHAQLFVRDCTFRNSEDFAIVCVTKGTGQDKQTGAFYEKLEDGTYKYNDGADSPYYFNSTLLHIDRCKFLNCMRVYHGGTDKGVISNCTIETNPGMKGAAIWAWGLKLENVGILAHVREGNNQRVIDRVGTVTELILKNVKVKTDSDKGICAVYEPKRYVDTAQGGAQAYLIIDSCEFQSAGSPENAIVYCKEVPNMIVIRDTKEISGKEVNAVAFEKIPDAQYFSKISADGLRFIVNERNSKNIITRLPLSMEPFVDKPLPEEIAGLFKQPEPIVDTLMMRKFIKKSINVSDFGANADGTTDASEAIKSAIKAASEIEGTEILFNNGHYVISKPIELPAEISIRGLGTAYLNADGVGTVFQVKDAKRVAFSNLIICNAKNAIDIRTKSDTDALILIDHCLFGATSDFAIRCGTKDMNIAEENRIHLLVKDTVFTLCRQVLETNAKEAIIDSSWVATDNKMLNQAAIVNKGTFIFKDSIGIPYCEEGQTDHRWIDNYHRVICDNVRFGGEYGGMCLVNQRFHNGQILIENGWLYALGNAKRRVSIFLEKIPEFVALRTNTGCNGGTQTMIGIDPSVKERRETKGWFFTSGNTIPVNNP